MLKNTTCYCFLFGFTLASQVSSNLIDIEEYYYTQVVDVNLLILFIFTIYLYMSWAQFLYYFYKTVI